MAKHSNPKASELHQCWDHLVVSHVIKSMREAHDIQHPRDYKCYSFQCCLVNACTISHGCEQGICSDPIINRQALIKNLCKFVGINWLRANINSHKPLDNVLVIVCKTNYYSNSFPLSGAAVKNDWKVPCHANLTNHFQFLFNPFNFLFQSHGNILS